VHVNVTGLDPDDPLAHTIEDRVLRLAVACGGTIAAEHGIGIAKREWLGATRSPTEIAAFRRIKQALDPGGTLNPGVILP
jgi:FAD/FMN-containing dehydrogenase